MRLVQTLEILTLETTQLKVEVVVSLRHVLCRTSLYNTQSCHLPVLSHASVV